MINKVIPIVQNVDRIVRVKDYKHLGTDRLLVTSVFRTIQGEGPYAGYPAVFLRLAGCNFGDKSDHCSWCDTSFQFDNAHSWTFEDLLKEVHSIEGYQPSDILVVTGGEPTLQHNLIAFMNMAQHSFDQMQIETNGTQAAFFEKFRLERHFDYPCIVVSPKASTKAKRTPKPAEVVLRNTDALKFVITADVDDPQHTVPEWALEERWKHQYKLYVSPMAVYKRPYSGEVASAWDASLIDQEATAANYAYAAQYAMKHGLMLSLQTHLFTAIP